ncbi:MAG: class II aldolase/adducin family protein [bacterium]
MSLKKELVDICNKVYTNGFVAALDGNLSARVDSERILITPSAKNKGSICEKDLLLIDLSGNLIDGSGIISTESKIHILAYKHRPEVNAVIHAHPIYATAFAAMGEGFTKPIFPEVVVTLGKVPLCKYATPSTDQVTQSMMPYIEYVWALLLENHGAVTLGTSIDDAYNKLEKLEHTAKILSVIRSFGSEKIIPSYKLKELYDVAENTYNLKIDKRNRMDQKFY